MKHQYDYDAQTVMGFLDHYGLARDFKLNIEPNHTTLAGHAFYHDIVVASQYGAVPVLWCCLFVVPTQPVPYRHRDAWFY